jgi:uncharacterized cupin superfamily protein
MKKVNLNTFEPEPWDSPKGTFAGRYQAVSIALGRDRHSTDLMTRHPFDVEIATIPPGKKNYPYHSHSAQWEYYQVMTGTGVVRHQDGETAIEPGDAFIFKPGEPHQITNTGTEDLVLFTVADNPVGEVCHYPDSGKWLVHTPGRTIVRSEPLDYFDGEE